MIVLNVISLQGRKISRERTKTFLIEIILRSNWSPSVLSKDKSYIFMAQGSSASLEQRFIQRRDGNTVPLIQGQGTASAAVASEPLEHTGPKRCCCFLPTVWGAQEQRKKETWVYFSSFSFTLMFVHNVLFWIIILFSPGTNTQTRFYERQLNGMKNKVKQTLGDV